MQACCGSCDCTLFFCENGLEVLCILRKNVTSENFFWYGRLAKSIKRPLELLVGTVVKETKGTAAAGGVVDDLCHHRFVFAEIKFVADTYLAGRVDQHIPKAHLSIELAQQEDLYLGTSFLLVAVKACRKDLGVVEYEDILFVEVIDDIAEGIMMFNNTSLGMYDHEATIVAERCRFLCDAVFWKLVLELL